MIRKITWRVNGAITLRCLALTSMLLYQLIPIFKNLRFLSAHLVLFITKYLPSLTDPILQSHTLPMFDCQTRTTLLPSQKGSQPLKPLRSCFSFHPPDPASLAGESDSGVLLHTLLTGHHRPSPVPKDCTRCTSSQDSVFSWCPQ